MYIGVCLPDSKHHVTIAFNGHGETKEDYQAAVIALANTAWDWNVLEDGEQIWLEFGELHVFDPPGVWVTRVRSKKLDKFRKLLTENLTYRGVYWSDEFDYIPHVTLSYYKKPKVNPYENQHMQVTRISVVSDEFGVTEVLI